MTASELASYFSDREFFPNPGQEVRFTLCPYGTLPSEKLDIRSTTVPEEGEAVVELKPAPKRKFMFSLKFEANPVIEAQTLEEAEKMAFKMMRSVKVVEYRSGVYEDRLDYVAQEPYLLEEVKE